MFHETIPQKCEQEMYLPARDMLDYVLVRLQGLSKLLCRIAECAQEGALYMENRIRIGHFWKVALICFGLLSRIWVLIKNYIAHCCDFYKSLLPYREKLQNGADAWLPTEYVFPVDLRTWLDIEWLEIAKISEIPEAKLLLSHFDDNTQFSNKIDVGSDSDIEIISERTASTEEASQCSNNNNLRGFESPIIFETVTEETQTKALANISQTENVRKRKQKRKENKQQTSATNTSNNNTLHINNTNPKKPAKTDILDSLNSVGDIKRFLKNEDAARTENLNKCVLKKLDRLQWNMLRKNILKVIAKNKKGNNTNKCVGNVKNIIKMSVS